MNFVQQKFSIKNNDIVPRYNRIICINRFMYIAGLVVVAVIAIKESL